MTYVAVKDFFELDFLLLNAFIRMRSSTSDAYLSSNSISLMLSFKFFSGNMHDSQMKRIIENEISLKNVKDDKRCDTSSLARTFFCFSQIILRLFETILPP